MNWLLEPFQHAFMQRALLACALIGFTNGFLGAIVVLRRLALMADSLSHALLPGLAVGIIVCGLSPIGLFLGALVAAGLVAIGAELVAQSSRVKIETALAVLYTVAFSAGIILLSFAPVRIDLHDYLFGNILGVSDADLWVTYGISFCTITIIAALQRPLIVMLFDPVVAATQGLPVTALNYLMLSLLVLVMISSLQAVGVILALGLLVAPAATMYLLSDSASALFWGGGFIGLLGSCAGLLISYWTDLPSGACIVLVLGFIFCAAYLGSPRYGLLRRWFRKPHFHEDLPHAH
jgi:ABC-type Mn2+/Zn2+ transport system permease subunit